MSAADSHELPIYGNEAVNSFDHAPGETRYDAYAPDDVEPALDAAEAAAVVPDGQPADGSDGPAGD